MLNESTQDLLLLATTRRDAEVYYEIGGTLSEETRQMFDEITSSGDGAIPKFSQLSPIAWYRVAIPSWGKQQLVRSTPECRLLLVVKPDRSLWIWRPDHAKPVSRVVRIVGTATEHIYYKMVKMRCGMLSDERKMLVQKLIDGRNFRITGDRFRNYYNIDFISFNNPAFLRIGRTPIATISTGTLNYESDSFHIEYGFIGPMVGQRIPLDHIEIVKKGGEL